MTSSCLPKILVATAFPPDVPGGSPWLLYQLLRGISPDRVSWWSASGSAPAHTVDRVGSFMSGKLPPRLVPHRRYRWIKSILLEWFWVPKAVKELKEYIRDQNPDMIWILGYSWSIPVLHKVMKDVRIPWHITVHDLADSTGQVQSLGPNRSARFQKMVDDLYAGASSRDVYMQETGDEMERTTGYKSDLIIRCGVEPEEIEMIKSRVISTNQKKICIGYPGTIIAEDTFVSFMKSLRIITKLLPLSIEVHLFGIHSYKNRPWYDESIIVEHGYLSAGELERRYRLCNWGLAIMELDDSNPRYSRFTFPCKFTRALADGLPIITIGHPLCTLTRFASKYQLGPVITNDDPQKIANALKNAFSENHDSEKLRGEILRCVVHEFNAELNRGKLMDLFLKNTKSKQTF